jgi:plasmid stabilization system protein ParE
MEASGDKYELFLLPRAEADVNGILQFLAERSQQGALRWLERWNEVLDLMRAEPLASGLAPESSEYECDIRQTLFKTRRGRVYRALFTVVGRGVYVLNVRGPGQNLVKRHRTSGR